MHAQLVAEPERQTGRERSPLDGPSASTDASVLEIMATTRAMRRLAPDPVPDSLLRSVIEAATWAPTGRNAQAETYILVTDRGVMVRLAPLWRRCVDDYLAMSSASRRGPLTPGGARVLEAILYQRDHFAETPAVIVVCYDNREVARDRRSGRVVRRLLRSLGIRRFLRVARASGRFARWSEAASVYPGVQNLLLAARAHGLGACMTTWHLLAEDDFKRVLGIPADVDTFAIIPIGWPLGSFGPVGRRPVDEVIHRDGWQSGRQAAPLALSERARSSR